MGMSTASLLRLINIDNTIEIKTEAKHSDKKTCNSFALGDTTFSAVDHFTVSHQQPKANNDSIHPLSFVSTKNNF